MINSIILIFIICSLVLAEDIINLPKESIDQVQYRSNFALKSKVNLERNKMLSEMKGSADYLFENNIKNDFLSLIDSIVTFPENELVGSCCGVEADKLSLFFKGGLRWSILFTCGKYDKGYLIITKYDLNKGEYFEIEPRYYVYINEKHQKRLISVDRYIINEFENNITSTLLEYTCHNCRL